MYILHYIYIWQRAVTLVHANRYIRSYLSFAFRFANFFRGFHFSIFYCIFVDIFLKFASPLYSNLGDLIRFLVNIFSQSTFRLPFVYLENPFYKIIPTQEYCDLNTGIRTQHRNTVHPAEHKIEANWPVGTPNSITTFRLPFVCLSFGRGIFLEKISGRFFFIFYLFDLQ